MQKIKLIVNLLFINLLVGLVLLAKPAFALAPTVSITELGEYINSNSFNLSYSALTDDPGATNAQFYYRKEGGSFTAFGPLLIGASGHVQVTPSQVNEHVKYYFKVEINSGVASDETSSNYDTSGPSPVQNYWKEKVAPGLNRLHWKNPGDSDFSRTFIYRGETPGFSADGSHKVGEVGGAPDAEMSWDNFGLDASKTYYYALRAIDKADNSASLVGDAEVTVQSPSVTGVSNQAKTESKVSELPKEASVLAEITEKVPSPASTKDLSQNASSEVKGSTEGISSKWIIFGIVILAIVLGLFFLYLRKKRNNIQRL